MNIGDFFKSNWLKIVSYVLVLVVGVALGWGTKPDVIQEKVQIVQVEKQIVVEKEVIKEVKVGLAQWHVSVGGALGPQLDPLRLSGTFDVAVERRIVGPFFLGLTANIGTDFQKVSGFGGGLRIGAEF